MLRYIVILLDDMSVPFCHYKNPCTAQKTIPLDLLHRGIIFAMKENLNIQFVYANKNLTEEYKREIESIDHTKIVTRSMNEEDEEVYFIEEWWRKDVNEFPEDGCVIIQATQNQLQENKDTISQMLERVARLNIMLVDIADYKEKEFELYKTFLEDMSGMIVNIMKKGRMVQLNLLTDRLFLKEMNNCGAGDFSITLAPNGNFYACPAFYYYTPDMTLGNLEKGLIIENPQLYRLDHAPICRQCDAYQCKRCIWLNQQTTLDFNTPSHEQCVVAHLERNASRILLEKLSATGIVLSDCQQIKEIDYLDPFNIVNRWK